MLSKTNVNYIVYKIYKIFKYEIYKNNDDKI